MTIQNQSQPYNPIPGLHKITNINVVYGRKMIPRIGHSQLPLKAALNIAGRAIQMKSVPSRGNIPANNANRQGMIFFSKKPYQKQLFYRGNSN
jgi:hypothetical protein